MNGPQSEQPAGPGQLQLLAVWEEARPELLRLVAAMGWSRHTGQDILQDVYLAAMKARPCEQDPRALRRWLFRVTVNRSRQEHRKTTRRKKAIDVLTRSIGTRQGSQDVGQDIEDSQETEAVRCALSKLDYDVRAPLILRYFLEMDSRQIGLTLGLSDSTIRSRLRAGRLALAAALRKAGYERE